MNTRLKNMLFLLFFLSGFCGLIYQVVWIRLSFSAFGIITPILSVVISVFMLGLSLGSYFGGKLISFLKEKNNISAISFYALTEIIIGMSALVIPFLFEYGENILLPLGGMDSFTYLLFSGGVLAISIFPWCFCMGLTFPFMMAYVREQGTKDENSFSFLYLANVIGAMIGAFTTVNIWIELLGLQNTLLLAASCNFLVAFLAFSLTLKGKKDQKAKILKKMPPFIVRVKNPRLLLTILFTTGFTSMAMEVIWTRAFTTVMGTRVYSFAMLLTGYLLATWIGSFFYRTHKKRGRASSTSSLLAWAIIASLLPLVANDPRFHSEKLLIIASIMPFCGLLGYLTPKLIDKYSKGHPDGAGRAYAVNITGGILGPISAGYFLLPMIGTLGSLLLLSSPFIVFFLIYFKSPSLKISTRLITSSLSLGLLSTAIFYNITYEERSLYGGGEEIVLRDHTATVVASGAGRNKRLIVNGMGITHLTPITKVMSHLPLWAFPEKPLKSLVICLGMGTSFRSLYSWGIETWAVELVPSVKKLFPFYFSDAKKILEDEKAQIVVDDGRRFLKRSKQNFDVITIDPPPPVEASGSGLLYSSDFYTLIKKRLTDNGILQQWYPNPKDPIFYAVIRTLKESFPYIRIYKSIEDWGFHILASKNPINLPDFKTLMAKMPESAKKDLMEWTYGGKADIHDLNSLYKNIVIREIPYEQLIKEESPLNKYYISDDKPFNEYYFLRRRLQYLKRKFHLI